jgi:hypothetical protein
MTVSIAIVIDITRAKGEQTQQPASSYKGRFANKDALAGRGTLTLDNLMQRVKERKKPFLE